MDKLLLTGASGFLGQPLSLALQQSYNVVEVRRQTAPTESANVIEADLLQLKDFDDLTKQADANVLVHSAWSMAASDYNLPSNFDWVEASISLVKSFVENGGTTVVGIGSCVQYDWSQSSCVEDTTPRNHANTYAECKNIIEDFVKAYCASRSVRCVWLRPFFMYGPAEDPNRLVADIATSLIRGETATIRNGGLYRDYMHTRDVAQLSHALINSDVEGVCNVGAGNTVSLGEIGETIAGLLGKESLLKIEMPESNGNTTVVADLVKCNNYTNYKPQFSLETGLEDTLNWWKKHV